MKKVALITLHGMGSSKENYELELKNNLKEQLPVTAWERLSIQAVRYDQILQGPQSALWEAMSNEPKNNLDGSYLRRSLLYAFSDATSLEHSSHHDEKHYQSIQLAIKKALDAAYQDMGGADGPVIIIAQSLGCQVLSSYIWDEQNNLGVFKNPSVAMNDFNRLKTLKHLVTTGCNIPLFVAGLSKRQCFNKPCDDFLWDNFYDPDDVLGWPLRQLDKSYEILKDHPISVGGFVTGATPMSHTQYWKDSKVISHLVDVIKQQGL